MIIKEKYNVDEIELNNDSTSLEKWFNEVVNNLCVFHKAIFMKK